MNLMQAKRILRQKIRAEMKSTPDEYFHSAGQEICRRLLASDGYRQSHTIFCFVSHGKEPDMCPLLEQALADGKTLCVPLCKAAGQMEVRQIHSLDELAPGAYGIPEPPADSRSILPDEIDLALIPCLAATKDGRRLGKGGGYYDRFLAVYAGEAVLICPARFLLEEIPVEEHDVCLEMVLTE